MNKYRLNINGKTSTVKTDKNGYATLSITNLPGKYTVTASYKGQTVKNTVQVKQNLKASKVTVKKSAKKLVLKATLSKVKGKKLSILQRFGTRQLSGISHLASKCRISKGHRASCEARWHRG